MISKRCILFLNNLFSYSRTFITINENYLFKNIITNTVYHNVQVYIVNGQMVPIHRGNREQLPKIKLNL